MANYPNLVSVTPNEVHSVTSPLAATWSFDQIFSVESAAGWFEADATGALTTIPLGQSGPFVLEVKAEQILCSEIRGTTVYVYQDNSINGRAYNSTSAVAHPLGDAVTLIATSVQAQVITANSPTFTGVVTSPAFKATGLTGAAVAGRWVGNTVSGAPASGTFLLNDWITSQDGNIYICTVAGTPGTWVGGGGSGSQGALTGDVTAPAGNGSRVATLVATAPVRAIIALYSAVTSVFGRTGAITAQSGDYNATQVPNVVVVTAQSATPAIDTDVGNVFSITGLAQGITSMTTNLTGTPVQGQQIIVEITDNGTPHAIAWGAAFEATGIALPTGTVAGLILRTQFTWNTVASKWDVEWSTVAMAAGLISQVNAATSGAIAAAIGDAINVTAAATITLPASPAIGQAVLVTCANAYGFATTITANTGQTINGGAVAGSVSVATEFAGSLTFQILLIAISATAWKTVSSGTDLGGGFEVTGTFHVGTGGFDVSGPMGLNGGLNIHTAVSRTTAYTTARGDLWVRATSGSWTLTLGTPTDNQELIITNEGAGVITVTPQTGTINGGANRVLGPNSSIIVIADGTNWHIIGSYGPGGNVSSPAVVSGTAFIASAVPSTVYFQINATVAGSYTLTMGPSTGAENTIGSAVAMLIGSDAIVSLAVPANWKVVLTVTSVTIGSTSVVTSF